MVLKVILETFLVNCFTWPDKEVNKIHHVGVYETYTNYLINGHSRKRLDSTSCWREKLSLSK